MKEWYGSAAICINDQHEVLMVKANDTEGWAVPSGGMENGETPEECCIREVKEETGYSVEIINERFVKETEIEGIFVRTSYFLVRKIGESLGIQDPDNTIIEVGWKSFDDVASMIHAYPEDQDVLLELLKTDASC
ncbi:NUDIX hydrolase [Ornithinibacillus xuwenensis]|uniref:NUDIX hydrolase n=1 Tax=Ornithinibacillus xuwenensis TaxID=3144668 RepID=A0ABU9XHE8_9BACI